VRTAILVACVALLAAGCGSQGRTNRSAASAGSLEALLDRPGQNVAIVPGDGDFAPGPVRYSFLVIRHDASVASAPRARVWLARTRRSKPFEQATAQLEPIGVPGVSPPAEGDVTTIYVVHLTVPRPGQYWVVAEPVGGRPVQAIGSLQVKPRTASVAVGANAPRSRTPTFASTHGDIAALTTASPPDRALLRYSVADSLAARVPFVVTFATPRYCTSRTCGPVVDVVERVRRRFERRGIRFIHVEVFRNNNPSLGYNRWMEEWHLQTEPWVYLVRRNGRIAAKFEGSVSVAELATAVRRYLS
jgi:hypothetical protein